jgi:hypothetical protein
MHLEPNRKATTLLLGLKLPSLDLSAFKNGTNETAYLTRVGSDGHKLFTLSSDDEVVSGIDLDDIPERYTIHPLIQPLTHPLIHSLIHSLIAASHTPSHTPSLIHDPPLFSKVSQAFHGQAQAWRGGDGVVQEVRE